MKKRTIKETIREFDENGKVTKERVTETTEYDDTNCSSDAIINPFEN